MGQPSRSTIVKNESPALAVEGSALVASKLIRSKFSLPPRYSRLSTVGKISGGVLLADLGARSYYTFVEEVAPGSIPIVSMPRSIWTQFQYHIVTTTWGVHPISENVQKEIYESYLVELKDRNKHLSQTKQQTLLEEINRQEEQIKDQQKKIEERLKELRDLEK